MLPKSLCHEIRDAQIEECSNGSSEANVPFLCILTKKEKTSLCNFLIVNIVSSKLQERKVD